MVDLTKIDHKNDEKNLSFFINSVRIDCVSVELQKVSKLCVGEDPNIWQEEKFLIK